MKMRKLLALIVATLMIVALFAGCKPKTNNAWEASNLSSGHKDEKVYTYNDYVTSFATDWNPHTWETNADSSMLGYLTSGLYEFKFNDDMTSAELFPFMTTKDPVDVTKDLTAEQKAKYGLPADAESGYAYQYTLRDDLAFEDGYKITAQTFSDSLKLLLDPKRANGRSATVTRGETAIAGAVGYYNHGEVSVKAADPSSDISKGVYFSLTNSITWAGDDLATFPAASYGIEWVNEAGEDLLEKWDAYIKANGGYNAKGFGRIADSDLEAFIADWTYISNTYGGGAENEWQEFIFVPDIDYTDPKFADFSNVGIIVDEELVFTFVHSAKVTPFNAIYYQTSTFLVHPEVYEQYSKQEGDLLTTSYMTSKDTSISYGPYKLASYESDKEMVYIRNESWFGYTVEDYDKCYSADSVNIRMLADQATALLSFLKGEIEGTLLASTDLADYGTSDYLLVTPTTYLQRFFYNLGLDSLKALDADDSSNTNTVALTNTNFRLAISSAIDRNEFTKITNGTPAFAMINDLYTYDYEGEMADGARYRYRDLDVAKESILNIYGIKWGKGTEYSSLDMAADAVTGYDPEYAQELMKKAFEELSNDAAATGFDPSKPVKIKLGYMRAALDPTALAVQAEVNAKMAAAIEGSGFAGFEFEFVSDNDRYGAVQEGRIAVSYGAIGAARQDPWGITSTLFDPTDSLFMGGNLPVYTDMLDITAKFDGEVEETLTKSLYDWYVYLTVDLVESTDVNLKAQILGALETKYLKQGYATPIQSNVDLELHSIRTLFPLEEADPIMGFGGLQYVKFSMDDAEWATYISENLVDNVLPYK